jgi:hypothetical protein
MKNAALAVTLLLALSCSSNRGVDLLRPELHLVQLSGPAQNLYQRGIVSIRYKLYCHNRSTDPITLRTLELRPLAPGGYLPDPTPLPFGRDIGPDSTASITFHARAFEAGGNAASNIPVSVRIIAYFETPTGGFHQTFIETLDQMEASGRE